MTLDNRNKQLSAFKALVVALGRFLTTSWCYGPSQQAKSQREYHGFTRIGKSIVPILRAESFLLPELYGINIISSPTPAASLHFAHYSADEA